MGSVVVGSLVPGERLRFRSVEAVVAGILPQENLFVIFLQSDALGIPGPMLTTIEISTSVP